MSGKIRIEIPSEKIAEFCRKHRIRKLAFFGSVLRKDFRPDSDVDLLVDFGPDAKPSLFDLVDIQDELSALLGRKVDLIEESSLRNPFRRYEILHTQEVIYAS